MVRKPRQFFVFSAHTGLKAQTAKALPGFVIWC